MYLHNRINIEWKYLRRVVYITYKLRIIMVVISTLLSLYGTFLVQDEDSDFMEVFGGAIVAIGGLIIFGVALFTPIDC